MVNLRPDWRRLKWSTTFGLALAAVSALLFLSVPSAGGGIGDPQVRTDDPWYPGELACSTFPRLFASQERTYRRVTGREITTDHEKAMASWLWRNTQYYHGEEGAENLWGRGFRGGDLRSREYWTGLFAHGMGLCGTTHSQWTAEMEQLLGHGRGRGAGVSGHNSFEVFLMGDAYGPGRWALLDHDLSTVIFDADGARLLSLPEVMRDWRRLVARTNAWERQQGWLVCGLHPDDGSVYNQYNTAEYLAGYAGVPPMVHLRRGETLRRYHEPGLESGRTYVFWGRNYNTGGIPGPERSITWVNQPDKMYRSTQGAGFIAGQARYANAVYTYRPKFGTADYKDGVIAESDSQVTFEFYSPYIIGASPANDSSWGIYDPGGRNGLRVTGRARCRVEVSVDQGGTWQDGGVLDQLADLTDFVKGHRQYWIRFGAGARELAGSGLTMVTVCQANAAILPRLHDGSNRITYRASGRAVVSAGPNKAQAQPHVIAGDWGSPRLTMELKTPRGERVSEVYAAAHIASGNPPNANVRYFIDYSLDGGAAWQPLVEDWIIPRRGEEPKDFWSQSFCYGSTDVSGVDASRVQVRFRNDGGKNYLRAELHLVYEDGPPDPAIVTFAWREVGGERRESHRAAGAGGEDISWTVEAGREVKNRWVEFEGGQ